MTKKSKDSTAPNTTGERTRTAKELLARSKARMAKPGDPIFDLGWIVGERRSTPLSKSTQATKEPKPKISETTPREEPTNLLEQAQADIRKHMIASGLTVKVREPRAPGEIIATFIPRRTGKAKVEIQVSSALPELFYTDVPHMDSLVFAPPEIANEISEVYFALKTAKTWGQFRSLMPSDQMADLERKWLEDKSGPWGDDEPFEAAWTGYLEAEYPRWLQADQDFWLPEEFLENWGKQESGFTSGGFWTFDPKKEEAIVADLKALGYLVTRRDDLNFY
jgi:hypothetical protein